MKREENSCKLSNINEVGHILQTGINFTFWTMLACPFGDVGLWRSYHFVKVFIEYLKSGKI
jgi:hypothetical protein